MSFFGVTIEKIGTVEKHPNADRLEVATLKGRSFQFIVQAGLYKPNDKVIYFPVDSVLDDWIISRLGLDGKLSGANKNRVKTIKLRGLISQGLVTKATNFKFGKLKPGTNVSDLLGVIKFEPKQTFVGKNTRLITLPADIRVYDIEGVQNYLDAYNTLAGEYVYVTEKLEGTHYILSYLPTSDEFDICSRRMKVLVDTPTYYDDNPYWKVTTDRGYLTKIKRLSNIFKDLGYSHERITLRGELLGNKIQNNIYGLTDYEVYFFEIELDGLPISSVMLYDYFNQVDLKHVPILYQGLGLDDYLGELSIEEKSNGYSVLNPKQLREGIVIRPYYECNYKGFGRLILKQRSPEYLANSDL